MTFVVTEKVSYPREEVPIDKVFYRKGSPAGLNLITCDGVFNPVTRHYDHRSVVRAVRS